VSNLTALPSATVLTSGRARDADHRAQRICLMRRREFISLLGDVWSQPKGHDGVSIDG
jgi:hypothetical protein